MKKILLTIIITGMIVGVASLWYTENYSSTSYYIKISDDGEVEKGTFNDNTPFILYRYKVSGFDSSGNEKLLEFTADHNLRYGAYIELLDNKKRGVFSWEEVKRSGVPQKARDKLK